MNMTSATVNAAYTAETPREHLLARIESLAEFGRYWQRQMDNEQGKTSRNGWSSRELQDAALRYDMAEAKRDAAWAEHDRIVDLAYPNDEDLTNEFPRGEFPF